MSNEEYVIFGLKRLLATLYFKHTGLPNTEAIGCADELLRELDD